MSELKKCVEYDIITHMEKGDIKEMREIETKAVSFVGDKGERIDITLKDGKLKVYKVNNFDDSIKITPLGANQIIIE